MSDLSIAVSGHGPPVLFLHAGASAAVQWAAVTSLLDGEFRSIAPDMIGHGRSPMPVGTTADNAIERYVDELVAIVEPLGRPAHVVGHSFGGVVALELARRAPSCVSSLVLAEPVCFDALREGGHREEFEAVRAHVEGLAARVTAGDAAGAMAALLAEWSMGQWERLSDAQRAFRVAQADAVIRVGLVASTLWRVDDAALAHLQPISTLIVRGNRSPTHVLRIADLLAARVPSATAASVPGAGHLFPITHPGPFAALIRDHMRAAEGATSLRSAT